MSPSPCGRNSHYIPAIYKKKNREGVVVGVGGVLVGVVVGVVVVVVVATATTHQQYISKKTEKEW